MGNVITPLPIHTPAQLAAGFELGALDIANTITLEEAAAAEAPKGDDPSSLVVTKTTWRMGNAQLFSPSGPSWKRKVAATLRSARQTRRDSELGAVELPGWLSNLGRWFRGEHPVEEKRPEKEYGVQRISLGDDHAPFVQHQWGDSNPVLLLPATNQLGEVAAITDQGVGKDLNNQDRILIVRDQRRNLYLVDFDGMGGTGESGDVEIAVRIAAEAYAKAVKETGDPQKGLEAADQAIRDFNVKKFGSEDGGVGTVAVSALITPQGEIHFHWAGDARGALYEPGANSQFHLAFRTLDDKFAVKRKTSASAYDSFVENILSSHVTNCLGKASLFGRGGMVVRKTPNGLVPGPGSESGFRSADKLKSGIKLKPGSVVILASDGGIFFWEDVPDIIHGLASAEAILKALHEEAYYRMKIFTEIPLGYLGVPFTYQGRASRLRGKKLFIDRPGHVYDSPSSEQPLARFARDHVSIIVYRHPPQGSDGKLEK